MLLSRSLLLAAAALAAAPAFAQRPSSWAALSLGGPPQAAAIRQLGKTCTYLQGTTLHAFSAFTRRWVALGGVAAGSQVAAFNDLAYAWSPGRFSAFSAYRGRFASIAVSGSAQLLNPFTQSNDSILAVRDGATLWCFSAFTGHWTARALGSAAPLVAVQRHALVLADGGTCGGFSAYRGRWTDLATGDTASAAMANGSWGTIEGAQALYGYSAEHERWSTASWPTGPVQSFPREDLVLYAAPGEALAYSGLAGRFSPIALPSGALLHSNALVAVAQTPSELSLYSAVRGTWTRARVGPAAIVQAMPQVVIWSDATTQRVTAYSPFTARAVPAPTQASIFQANQACAFAMQDPTEKPFLFSALAGDWFAAPSEAKPAQPSLTWCGALLQTERGFAAFSGRSGRFLPLATEPGAQPRFDVNSSVLAVEEAQALHAFDARFERWTSVAKQSPAPLTISIWRTTLLAIDGLQAHAFGSLSGEIETTALPAPVTIAAANSESARVVAGNEIFAFGATPDLGSLHQFPEFRRVFPLGGTLELQLAAAEGALALLGLGRVSPSPQNHFGFGAWWIDLASAAWVPLVIPAGEVRSFVRFPVPADPLLRGLEPAFQAWVLPPSGTGYATRRASVGLR